MTQKVKIKYVDKRHNKPYSADEVYVPSDWSSSKITEWFNERHSTFVDPSKTEIVY